MKFDSLGGGTPPIAIVSLGCSARLCPARAPHGEPLEGLGSLLTICFWLQEASKSAPRGFQEAFGSHPIAKLQSEAIFSRF